MTQIDDIMNNTIYIRHNGYIGLASFHFNKTPLKGKYDCYINYENAPSGWVTDDKQKFPNRKYFENIKYLVHPSYKITVHVTHIKLNHSKSNTKGIVSKD